MWPGLAGHSERNRRFVGWLFWIKQPFETVFQSILGPGRRRRRRGRQKRWELSIKEWTGMDFASSARAVENNGMVERGYR